MLHLQFSDGLQDYYAMLSTDAFTWTEQATVEIEFVSLVYN